MLYWKTKIYDNYIGTKNIFLRGNYNETEGVKENHEN